MGKIKFLCCSLLFILNIHPSSELISNKFAKCSEHFYNSFVPKLSKTNVLPVYICQQYEGKIYYATSYDPELKTPSYSAYYKAPGTNILQSSRGTDNWKYEPELVRDQIKANAWFSGNLKDMQKMLWNKDQDEKSNALGETMPVVRNSEQPDVETFQHSYHYRVNPDWYRGPTIKTGHEPIPYDKGHLLPSSFATNKEFREATCAVTNSAPQDPCLNRIKWKNAEADLKSFMDTSCPAGHQYFIIGTALNTKSDKNEIPPPWTNEGNPQKRNRVITIPDWFWTAACCVQPQNTFAIGYYSTSNDEKADVIWTELQYLEYHFETNSHYGGAKLFHGDKSAKTGCYRDAAIVRDWILMQKAVDLATKKWKESPNWRMKPDLPPNYDPQTYDPADYQVAKVPTIGKKHARSKSPTSPTQTIAKKRKLIR